mmetsp:Transcript_38527/g.43400  ORF Transcript_38527/g.43400 Transcript_38527/m.43400 type:complete len:82 (-) Transcript_38527:15-260(-)
MSVLWCTTSATTIITIINNNSTSNNNNNIIDDRCDSFHSVVFMNYCTTRTILREPRTIYMRSKVLDGNGGGNTDVINVSYV